MKIDKKKIIIFFIILISFLIILLFGKSSNASEDNIVETTEETVEVSNQTIITTLTAPGEVQSAKTEKISLNTNYYYLTMCAEENEYIKKGDNLLEYTNGTYITAPYDCIITEYSVPNAKDICTSDNYIQISSVEDLYMEINIGEDKIGKISSGQEVSIVVNYDETKEYTGNISKINAIGTHNTGGSTFTAIASIKNDGNLKLGMSATCEIIIERAENVVAVPVEAIQTSDEGKYVIVVNSDGSTSNVSVETGICNDAYTEIKSGISEGTTIQMTESSEDSRNGFNMNFNGNAPGGREMTSNFENPASGGEMPNLSEMPETNR